MASRLRIGVIGLGRRWPRYQKALSLLPRLTRLVAVYDPAAGVARDEASKRGCVAAGSVAELVEREDVEAILLTGGMWSGLWAVEQAARAGKPILCAGSLMRDEEHIDEMLAKIGPDAAVHMTLWPALEFLLEHANGVLGETLGSPLFAIGGHGTGAVSDPFDSGAVLALLRGMANLFESTPSSVRVGSSESQPGLANATIEFDNGSVGQLAVWNGAAVPRTWLEIDAEEGWLRVELPRSLNWYAPDGRRSQEIPGWMPEVWVVDRFAKAVRDGEEPALSFEQAHQTLTWLRAMRQSRDEDGAEVELE